MNHARLKSGRKNKKTSRFSLLLRSVYAFFFLSLSLFHLLGSASPVCPSCASLTFDTHRFNNHQTFAERHKQPWPRLSPTGGPDATAPTAACASASDGHSATLRTVRASVRLTRAPSARHLEPPLLSVNSRAGFTSSRPATPPLPSPTHPPLPRALSLTCRINC